MDSFRGNTIEKDIQYYFCHWFELIATLRDDPIRRHFIERAEKNLRGYFRFYIFAKDSYPLPLFEYRRQQAQVLRKTSRRKLFHEFSRAAQFDLKDDREISIGAQTLQMQQGNPA